MQFIDSSSFTSMKVSIVSGPSTSNLSTVGLLHKVSRSTRPSPNLHHTNGTSDSVKKLGHSLKYEAVVAAKYDLPPDEVW